MNSREKILTCARDLFHQVGYQATSVDVILRNCGVAKSNFYYHFKTKDDLAHAVLDLQASEYEAAAEETLHNPDLLPADRLRRFCEQIGNTQVERKHHAGCPFGNFAAALSTSEGDERAEMFRGRLCVFFDRLERQLTECLTEGVALGEFRSDLAPQEMARCLLATIEGLMMFAKTRRDARFLYSGLHIAITLLQDR